MPLATIAAIAPQRNTLEGTMTGLNTALNHFETTYYSGATPIVPTPPELTRLITEGARLMGVLQALGTAHDHATIQTFVNDIVTFRDDIDNAQPLFAGHEAEWRTNVMNNAQRMEAQSANYISHASGSWIRRVTRRGLDTVGLNEHNRTATKRFLGRHKGTLLGTGAAGAILWGALSMDGCSPSQQQPPTGSKKPTNGEYHPINKRDIDGGKEYDGNGTDFSVGGFLNASKTTFGNGASPEAQAFQGVWNYIDEHRPDEKWGPGERFHFHTTPNKDLVDATHFDVNAYTGDHDTKVIEITWQKVTGKEKKGKNVDVEKLNHHTWKFVLHSNGTIELIHVYHDGREEKSMGVMSKDKFQERLKMIQGF